MKNKTTIKNKKYSFLVLTLFSFILMSSFVSATTFMTVDSATNIQDDRARLEGRVYSDDWSEVYAGFQYRSSGSSTWLLLSSSFAWLDTENAVLNQVYYDYVLTGLSPTTSYDFRPVVTQVKDNLGNGYSQFYSSSFYETFTTDEGFSAIEPIMDTLTASNVGQTQATLRGEIDDMGGASSIDVSFAYREQGGNWIYTEDTGEYEETFSNIGMFDYTLTGLSANTYYDYIAYGKTVAGYENGGTVTFITDAVPSVTKPSLSVSTPTSITTNSVQLNAQLSSLGDYTNVNVKFFYRSISDTGVISPIQASEDILSTTQSFSYSLTGLAPGTQYFYDIGYYDNEIDSYVLTNSGQTFTTTSVVYDWITTTKTNTVTNDTLFDETITGLESGTSYTFKACIDYDGETLCGQTKTFTTSTLTQPTINTLEVLTKSDTTAELRGELTNMGSFASVSVGFTIDGINVYTETLTEPGTFSYLMTGLDSLTEYYYNVYAYSPGEYFVEDATGITFTTLSPIFLSPSEIKPFPNILLDYNSTVTLNMNEYYEYYDEIILNINDVDFVLGNDKTITNNGNDLLNVKIYSILNNWFIDFNSFYEDIDYNSSITIKNVNGNLTDTFTIKVYENASSGIEEPVIKENLFTKATDFILGLLPEADDMTNTQKISFVSIFLIIVTILIVAVTLGVTKSLSIGVIYLALIIDSILLAIFIVKGYIPFGFVIAVGLVAGILGFFKIRGGMQ